MKKILNYLGYLPKSGMAIMAGLTALVLSSMIVIAGWSPARPTYTIEKPPTHITFNSITNNPDYGDERTFFDVKDTTNTNPGGFKDKMKVEDGQELLLRAYVHNNAADNLNLVAENTRVRFLIPTGFEKNLRSIAYISANNATPKTVSDTIDLYADQPFTLEFISGSAKQYTNVNPNPGFDLSDNIIASGGTLIGYDKVDGKVPGCFKYSSVVTAKVKVKMSKLDIQKTVSKHGANDYKEVVKNLKVGDKVDFRIKVQNVGSKNITDLTIADQLPKYLRYVKDSAYVYNTNYPAGRPIGNNLTKGGTILGDNYAPGGVAYVIFTAKVTDMADECGILRLTNTAAATAAKTPQVEDTAKVTVDAGECVEPIFRCESLIATQLTREKFRFKTTATATNGAKVTKYVLNFGDSHKRTINTDQTMVNVDHTYASAGTYEVTAKVHFDVNGEAKSKLCRTTVTVDEEPVPGWRMNKKVRLEGSTVWEDEITAKPGDKLEYRIVVNNYGQIGLTNILVKDVLPNGINYTIGSTTVNGQSVADGVTNNGLSLNSVAAGHASIVLYKATVDRNYFECGEHTLTNGASVKPSNVTETKSDTAKVIVDYGPCGEDPFYVCRAVVITKLGGRKIEANVDAEGKPVSLVSITGYSYDFGDGTKLPNFAQNRTQHTYLNNGSYFVGVVVHFNVKENGSTVKKDVNCGSRITFETPPPVPPEEKELPKTGPSSLIAALFGSSALGTAIRGWTKSRKELRRVEK